MLSATFFGHRDFDYSPYRDRVRGIIVDLIETHGVKEFLNGFRGNFDRLCAEEVFHLKTCYRDVKNILVLSYHDRQNGLPTYFDESLYLLEKRVPPQYAISYTNQMMILRSEFVVSGVRYHFGGAYTACRFAEQKKKMILDIFQEKAFKNDNVKGNV